MSTMIQKFGLIYTMAVLIVLTSCASRKEELSNKQGMLYFGAGTQSLMSKNYTDALTNLMKADELMPGNADIITNLGMAYFFKGEVDLAIRELNRALEIDKNHSDAKLNLATIYYQRGEILKAEQIYKNVLKDLTYDKQARTYYNLGILEAEKRKNFDAAEKYFKQALKEDENYCPAFHQLGLIQFNRAQYNTAEKTFREGTRGICVEFVSNHYYYGLTLVELRRYEDARIRFDEIDARFKDSNFAALARQKNKEIARHGSSSYTAPDSHASNKHVESPEF